MPGNDPRVQQDLERQEAAFAGLFPFRCPGRGLPHPPPPDSCPGCAECKLCPCGERLYCQDV